MNAFLKFLANWIMWKEYFFLLPLAVGFGFHRLNYSYIPFFHVVGFVVLAALFYVGVTAVGATLDFYDIFEQGFMYALAVALMQSIFGCLLAQLWYGPYIALEAQIRYRATPAHLR